MRHSLFFLMVPFLLSRAFGQGRQPPPVLQPMAIETTEKFVFRAMEDDQGGFYIAWTHPVAGGDALIFQHVDSQEASLRLIPKRHAQWPLASSQSWDAVADSKGGMLVFWEAQDHILAQRFDADLHPEWRGGFDVGVSTFPKSFPTGVSDGLGGCYIVWQEKQFDNRWVLMVQHVSPKGAAQWPAEGIRVSLRPSDQRAPSVVEDGQGGLIVGWQDFREQSSQLMAQRIDFQGNRLWDLQGVVVTAPGGDPKKPPRLGPVGQGSAVVAWQGPSAGANRTFLQFINPSGQPAWTPQGVDVAVGTWNEWNPVLYGDGEGGIWVGWEDYRNQVKWQIFFQHLPSSGRAFLTSGGLAIAAAPGDQGHLAVAENGQKGLYCAWIDNRYGKNGVYMQELNNAGEILWEKEGRAIAPSMTDPSTPQLVNLGSGKVAVVWADHTSKAMWSIYNQIIVPATPASGVDPVDGKR